MFFFFEILRRKFCIVNCHKEKYYWKEKTYTTKNFWKKTGEKAISRKLSFPIQKKKCSTNKFSISNCAFLFRFFFGISSFQKLLTFNLQKKKKPTIFKCDYCERMTPTIIIVIIKPSSIRFLIIISNM